MISESDNRDAADNDIPERYLADKGGLLYEPQWAANRKMQGPSQFLIGLSAVILSFIVDAFTFFSSSIDLLSQMIAILTSILLFLIGSFLILLCLRTMPFRMYENGFTQTSVSPRSRILGLENIITYDSVILIQVKESVTNERLNRWIDVIFLIQGREVKLRLDNLKIDDPYKVIRIFNRMVPSVLDPGIHKYITLEESGNAKDEDTVLIPERDLMKIMLTNLFLFLSPVVLLTIETVKIDVEPDVIDLIFYIFLIVIITAVCVTSMYIARLISLDDLKRSKYSNDSIFINLHWLNRIFIDYRKRIDINEIKSIELGLDDFSFSPICMIHLLNGESLISSKSIYHNLKRLPLFKASNGTLSPRNDPSIKGPKLFRYRIETIILYIIGISILLLY